MKTVRILLLLHALVLPTTLMAQEQEKLDSLLTILNSMPKDTAKVRVYGEICLFHILTNKNRPMAKSYADSIKLLSQELKFDWGIAEANYFYGKLNRYEANYPTALQYLKKFVKFHELRGDSLKVARGLFDMGVVYKNLGELDKSLAIFFRSLKIPKNGKEKKLTAFALNSIGNIYRQTDRQQDAIDTYAQANEIYTSLNMKKDYAMGLQNIGNCLSTLKRFDAARQKYNEALAILQNLDNDYETAIVLTNLGDLNHHEGKNKAALSFHLKALDIKKTLLDRHSLVFSLSSIGKIYLQLKMYEKAEEFLYEGLLVTKEINSKSLLKEIYGLLSELYYAQQNFKKAYDYYDLSTKMKDSIFGAERTELLARMQTKYETEKKDQQITILARDKELQEKETERQAFLKNTFVFGGALIAMLAFVITFTLRQSLRNQKAIALKNEEIQELNFKRQLTELEMKALQAQINPHFIFNCMNSINQMILDGNNPYASKYLNKFSKMIRLILENAENTEVSLKDELALLEAYIELEALRFKGNIVHEIKVEKSIDIENTYIPSMVLQPFVENAIWHGLMHKKKMEKGRIIISVERNNNQQLTCLIEDNGIGREKATELEQKSIWKRKSLGLKITEDRLKLVSKELHKQLVSITDLKDSFGHALGTRVKVNIPTY